MKNISGAVLDYRSFTSEKHAGEIEISKDGIVKQQIAYPTGMEMYLIQNLQILMSNIIGLDNDISELRNSIEKLTNELAMLRNDKGDSMIEINDISDEDAIRKILDLLSSSKNVLFLSEIVEKLNLDLEQAHRICMKLIEENKIYIPKG